MTQTTEFLRIPAILGFERGFPWVSCAFLCVCCAISPQCNKSIKFFRVNALARVYASLTKLVVYALFS